MAATGFNFRRLLRKLKAEVIFFQLQKILRPKLTLTSKLMVMTYIFSLKVSC